MRSRQALPYVRMFLLIVLDTKSTQGTKMHEVILGISLGGFSTVISVWLLFDFLLTFFACPFDFLWISYATFCFLLISSDFWNGSLDFLGLHHVFLVISFDFCWFLCMFYSFSWCLTVPQYFLWFHISLHDFLFFETYSVHFWITHQTYPKWPALPHSVQKYFGPETGWVSIELDPGQGWPVWIELENKSIFFEIC
mgnify:CR=1 FL=1